ncbi:MAG: polyprenol monophosphomannose synthase [Microbacteriaceae bacterium]|nr:polyprenol monophosphomannose synthase [Microbacteriaceae bacterium]
MSDVLVIVPTFNERESLASVLTAICQVQPRVDVLVVDDNSPDGTGQLADEFARANPTVHVIHREAKHGLGPAYIAGFYWAVDRDYDWVVQIDADGSHDPRVIPTLLAVARGIKADLVLGSRWVTDGRVDGWSVARQVVSRTGNGFARFALRSRVRDLTAGFRVLRVEALRQLHLETIASSGYCFQIEIADRVEQSGGMIIEHPITFIERVAGKSKMHFGIVVEALTRISAWGIKRWFLRR